MKLRTLKSRNLMPFHVYLAEMNKNFTYMKYSPEKKHTAETGGKKYTQDKQTNTQKMKHAPTEP